MDNGLPANNSEVEVEGGRERHAHSKEAEADKDRTDLEVGFELFSSDRKFFSPCGTKRAGITPNARINRTLLKKVRGR